MQQTLEIADGLIAYADINARHDKQSDFSYNDISEYHKKVFRNEGLSAYAWVGTFVEELFGRGKWMFLHDKDEQQFENMFKHALDFTDISSKTDYSNRRLFWAMLHSFNCYITGRESEFQPTVYTHSLEAAANAYQVDVSRVVLEDDNPTLINPPQHRCLLEQDPTSLLFPEADLIPIKIKLYRILPANSAEGSNSKKLEKE